MTSAAAKAAMPKVDVVLQHEIEQFLYEEAALLDERRFDEWLALLAPDLRYFMPNRAAQMSRDRRGNDWGKAGFPFFDDTRETIGMRVRRIQTGSAWAEEPPSRTRRLLTNVRLAPISERELAVRLNFCIYRSRGERDEDVFVGERLDGLRRADTAAGWTIYDREIRLDQTVLTHHNLSIFF